MAKSREQRTVSVALTDTLLVGPNNRRVGLVISAPLTNRFTLSFGGAAVLDQGITVYPAQSPLILLEETFGCALHEEIRAISVVAVQNVTYLAIYKE